MPELPEVETVRRGMDHVLTGRAVTAVCARRAGLRVPFPADLAAGTEGRRVTRFGRRGKYILMHLSGGRVLILHLGMSGRVVLCPPGRDYAPRPHDHLILTFDDGSVMAFNDARRFGMVLAAQEEEIESHAAFRGMGPEPLGNGFSGDVLFTALQRRASAVKAALMDQRVVAGLGNIYVCEALFRAGIHPERAARSLCAVEAQALAGAIRSVLLEAIAAGGSSLKDYRHADGGLGYFQHHFAVYGRAGMACSGCVCEAARTGGVRKIVQGGRSTWFCPERQV